MEIFEVAIQTFEGFFIKIWSDEFIAQNYCPIDADFFRMKLCVLWKRTSNHLWSFQEVFVNCNKCFTLAFYFLRNSCLTLIYQNRTIYSQRYNFLSALFRERFVQIDFLSFCICVLVVISLSCWENLPRSLYPSS